LQRIWAAEGITMLLVTHDVEEAVYLGGRVVVMATHPGPAASPPASTCCNPVHATAPVLILHARATA
jgi:ABC-type nitrate/sulfonate/bicarbonate transport system ATPase subunit